MEISSIIPGNKYSFTIKDGISNILGKTVTGEYIGYGFIKSVPNRSFVTTQYEDFKATFDIGGDIDSEEFYMFDVGGNTYVFAKSWIEENSMEPLSEINLTLDLTLENNNERIAVLSVLDSLGVIYKIRS